MRGNPLPEDICVRPAMHFEYGEGEGLSGRSAENRVALASLLRSDREVISGAWKDLEYGGRIDIGMGGSGTDRDLGSAGPRNLQQIPGETSRANLRASCLVVWAYYML